MKYLKRFEKYTLRYKENDYVIINTPDGEKVGQITDIKHKYADVWPYAVSLIYIDEFAIFMKADKDIVRLATPEEIEKYELEKNVYNYNL